MKVRDPIAAARSAVSTSAEAEYARRPDWWPLATRELSRASYRVKIDGDEAAEILALADRVAGQRRRWQEADRVAGALSKVTGQRSRVELRHRDTPDGPSWASYRVTRSVEIEGRTLDLDARPQPTIRHVYLQDYARKLATCGRTRIVGHTASGRLSTLPLMCELSLCSDCAGRRVDRLREPLIGAFGALATAGCPIVQVTFTMSAPVSDGPVVLSEEDLLRWPELAELHTVAGEGETGTATGGTSLNETLRRLNACLRRLMGGSSKNRKWWNRNVVAPVTGIETTARRTNADGDEEGPLRWHTHSHLEIALDIGTDVDAFAREIRARWVEAVAAEELPDAVASEAAQDVTIVSRGKTEGKLSADVRRSIRQVTKYPGKIPGMTTAAAVEFVVALHGRQTHRRGGALDSAGKSGAVARALAALAIERDGGSGDVDAPTAIEAAGRRLHLDHRPEEEELLAWLLHRHGRQVADALVKAWRCLLNPVGDELDEGEDAPDPIVGLLATEDRDGRRHLLTRGRLHAWAKAEKTAILLKVPIQVTDDRTARRVPRDPLDPTDGRRVPLATVLASLRSSTEDAWHKAREKRRDRRARASDD